jgi:carboxyl-terminal processing protease
MLANQKNKTRIENLKKNKKFMSGFRVSVTILVLAGVLFLGIGIGNGTITAGDGAYRRSVQKEGSKLSYDGIDQLYDELHNRFDGQLDTHKLEDGLKEGLVKAAGDPYTEYLSAEENKEFTEQLSGTFEGIGAELGKDGESIVIISPIDGFPAEKAGIRAKDIISKINGETAFDISTTEAVKKIRGPKGTNVKLDIIRDGKPLSFEITRDQISTPSVKWEVTSDNIGVMTISRFGEDTSGLAQQAAAEFKSKNVKGVILDVRGNPGGLLDASVHLSSLWLPYGKTILQEKRDNKVVKTYPAREEPVLLGIPTVVLMDEGSASASEITAGALKDNGVASIIGNKSYGKGSVQEIRELGGGSVLKVTIARWYTPNGRNIDKEGIEPDQKVDISEQDITAKKDPQKEAAISKLKN